MRGLPKNTIQTSILVSQKPSTLNLKQFGFLPETIGIIYGSGTQSWGCIIRETVARPLVSEKRFILPLFALYSGEILKALRIYLFWFSL